MSIKKLGQGAMLLGLVFGSAALFGSSTSSLVIFILLVCLGVAAIVAGGHIILAAPESVRGQMQKALDLLGFAYEFDGDRLVIAKTRTVVTLRGVPRVTWVSFAFERAGSERERYLAATLLKYARQA